MLTLLFSICMYQIAEREKRRGWLWGSGTFAWSALLQYVVVAGYWGAVLGLLSSYAAMTYANIKYPVNKGPFI
jgi:NADH:ubiquinone oxidoreductase subunit 6 (subunit J)